MHSLLSTAVVVSSLGTGAAFTLDAPIWVPFAVVLLLSTLTGVTIHRTLAAEVPDPTSTGTPTPTAPVAVPPVTPYQGAADPRAADPRVPVARERRACAGRAQRARDAAHRAPLVRRPVAPLWGLRGSGVRPELEPEADADAARRGGRRAVR